MRSSILYFLLLVLLRILLNLYLDDGYKQDGFFESLLEKNLKFVLSREDGTVAFNLSLCYCEQMLILSQRNESASGMRLWLVASVVLK